MYRYIANYFLFVQGLVSSGGEINGFITVISGENPSDSVERTLTRFRLFSNIL
jgi:hypothetical protein